MYTHIQICMSINIYLDPGLVSGVWCVAWFVVCQMMSVCDVRWMVCGMWYVVCGMWYGVCGLWCVVCGVSCVVCGVWSELRMS